MNSQTQPNLVTINKKSVMAAIINLLVVFVFCLLVGGVLSEWNTKDYLKKEHSLVKPYNGMLVWLIIYMLCISKAY